MSIPHHANVSPTMGSWVSLEKKDSEKIPDPHSIEEDIDNSNVMGAMRKEMDSLLTPLESEVLLRRYLSADGVVSMKEVSRKFPNMSINAIKKVEDGALAKLKGSKVLAELLEVL